MDKTYPIPADVAALCNRLRQAGYAAHPVGGAVRDLVLGRTPGDWDVASAAPPSVTAALFGDAARPTGLPHGTVTVDTGTRRVEVTAFRVEGPYSDGRRPDWVEFTHDLAVDLTRRDFTMNAMALDGEGRLIDPFGGTEDLEKKVIRTVGDPKARFQQDGLRLYRAARFAAQLDFELGRAERETLLAHPQWGGPVSAERIRTELEKGLCASAPQRLDILFSGGLLERFCPRCAPRLEPLADLPPIPAHRWAGLCRALEECEALDDAEKFLRAFHMDRRTVRGALEQLGP